MPRIPVSEARINFSELVRRVRYRGERIILTDRGVDAAVLVPVPEPAQKKPRRTARIPAEVRS